MHAKLLNIKQYNKVVFLTAITLNFVTTINLKIKNNFECL